jgi:hypothetical protein
VAPQDARVHFRVTSRGLQRAFAASPTTGELVFMAWHATGHPEPDAPRPLGVHFVSDVLAGYALGAAWVAALLALAGRRYNPYNIAQSRAAAPA